MTAPAFDFDRLTDRRSLPSEKWGRYAGRDVLPLWVADMDFAAPPAVIEALHRRIDHKAVKNFLLMQPGDVLTTYADIDDLERAIGFRPKTSLATGLQNFVAWYRTFYQIPV